MRDTVAIITGATGNVGWGAAWAFAEAGSTIVLPARSERSAEKLRRDFAETNAKVLIADMSAEHAAEAMRDQVLHEFGRIDHVVASIGPWWQRGPVIDQPLSELRSTQTTYLESHFLVAKAFIPAMNDATCSYTLVTGRGGEGAIPGAGLLVIGVMAQFGLARMLCAEHRDPDTVRVNELRIGCRIEREPAPEIVPSRVAGQGFVSLARSDVRSELVRFDTTTDLEALARGELPAPR